MLKLTDDSLQPQSKMFASLSPSEIAIHRKRGIPSDVLAFLSHPEHDPRCFAIKHYKWIRVRPHAFYLWKWDNFSLGLIRDAISFWTAQRDVLPHDAVDFLELSTWTEFALTVGQLRTNRSTAATLKRASIHLNGRFTD